MASDFGRNMFAIRGLGLGLLLDRLMLHSLVSSVRIVVVFRLCDTGLVSRNSAVSVAAEVSTQNSFVFSTRVLFRFSVKFVTASTAFEDISARPVVTCFSVRVVSVLATLNIIAVTLF